jgi:hypothetical protein
MSREANPRPAPMVTLLFDMSSSWFFAGPATAALRLQYHTIPTLAYIQVPFRQVFWTSTVPKFACMACWGSGATKRVENSFAKIHFTETLSSPQVSRHTI